MSSSSSSFEPVSFTLNGAPVEASGVDPHTSLLSFVRARGLTGSKEGCAEGECGACAVVVVREDGEGSRYEALNACLLPLPAAHGAEVWTVEGIGTPESPHPVQTALLRGGSQCGYCTPGFVASLFAEYHRRGREGVDEEALGGNLCRCTGYRPIREAARALGPAQESAFTARLARPAPVPTPLRHEAGGRAFVRPGTLAELLDLRRDLPGALLLAGGTDAMVEANLRGRRWDAVISLDAVQELREVRWKEDEGAVEIGAALDLAGVERALGGRVPLLAQLVPLFASPLVRARATLGGNLATASPVGDASPCLLALGASVRLASALGVRDVPLEAFFTGYRASAMRADEVLAAVRVPLPLPGVQRFHKIAKRGRDDISTVAVAVALDLAEDGTVKSARLGLGGVAATPARAPQTETFLTGAPFTAETARRAGEVLAAEFAPISDARGSALYRTALLRGALSRLHAELVGEAVA